MEMTLANLESTKLFIQPIRLNAKVPLATTRKVDLSSGYNGSIDVIKKGDRHAELAKANM